MVIGWRRRLDRAQPHDEAGADACDPYAPHVPVWIAFMDQARWLLDQQQRRDSAFQRTVAALIGFDGLLLAVLVSGDALANFDRLSTGWWAMLAGTACLVVSSFAAVQVLLPRATNSVGAEQTIDAWEEYHSTGEDSGIEKEDSRGREKQHFAAMLLSRTPSQEEPSDRRERAAERWRARLRRPELPTQPLLAAEALATLRAHWTGRSAKFLLFGIIFLAGALFLAPTSHSEPQPSQTSSVDAPRTEEGN